MDNKKLYLTPLMEFCAMSQKDRVATEGDLSAGYRELVDGIGEESLYAVIPTTDITEEKQCQLNQKEGRACCWQCRLFLQSFPLFF